AEITKEQLANPEINVFTGTEFSTQTKFDINNLSKEQLAYIQSLSQEELAAYMQSYSENATSTYEENLSLLGIVNLEEPDGIKIYPKDFDSKENITSIIDK